MSVLELLHTRTFDPEMHRLRREFSDQEWPNGSSADEFDAVSSHVVASVDGELAGMVRLTRRPLSVLAVWAIGESYLPDSREAAEATRGVVARKWRGMGLYKLLMSEATCLCHHWGVPQVVAAIELDFPLRGFLERIGFRCVGRPTPFRSAPREKVECQVIVQEPANALRAALEARESCVRQLATKGFLVGPSLADRAGVVLISTPP